MKQWVDATRVRRQSAESALHKTRKRFPAWALESTRAPLTRTPPYDSFDPDPVPVGDATGGRYIWVDKVGNFDLMAWVNDNTTSDSNTVEADVAINFSVTTPGWIAIGGQLSVNYQGFLQTMDGNCGGSILATMYLSDSGGNKDWLGQTLFWGGDPQSVHVGGQDGDLMPTQFSLPAVPVAAADYTFIYHMELGVRAAALGQNPTPRFYANARIDASLDYVTVGFLPKP